MNLELNKIYHGDCFKLIKQIPDHSIDLILEDMPYNTTSCKWDVKIDLELYWGTRLRILKPKGVIALTATQPFVTDLISSNRKMFKYDWIWIKAAGSGFLNCKIAPLRQHEHILIFGKGKSIYNAQKFYDANVKIGHVINRKQKYSTDLYSKAGDSSYTDDSSRYPKTILFCDHDKERYASSKGSKDLHPTQKPIKLFEYLIKTYTNEGDLVFDGFGGSGTTAIASHKSNRNFIVIEKEKEYFDLATKRLNTAYCQLPTAYCEASHA